MRYIGVHKRGYVTLEATVVEKVGESPNRVFSLWRILSGSVQVEGGKVPLTKGDEFWANPDVAQYWESGKIPIGTRLS